jgi:hypothetical protein
MKYIIATLIAASLVVAADPKPLPELKVSENKRFLVTADGKPFFYLGDTAWELFHRLDRKQAVEYLDLRARQKYNVIQAVALAELEGLIDPNAYGDLPLIDKDPTKPAVTPGANPGNPQQYDYWDHVDYIIDQANRRGIYIGLLPTWASWVPHENSKQHVFTAENAEAYGKFLGQRYRTKSIIWILGGDRLPAGFENIWRAMARGIAIGINGREDYSRLTMTFHPRGQATSSTWFHNDEWLTFNMHQTGHGPAQRAPQCYLRIAADYARTPVKPVMDGEPLYEDHPIGFSQAKEYGYSLDAHVRQRAYWDVFSGAFGHTYGNHSVWQMYSPERKPINMPLFYWYEAIHRPGASQMQYARALIESRPFLSRVPDQSIVVDPLSGPDYIAATRGDGYLFVYSAQGRPFTLNLGKISGEKLNGWLYNPRTGTSISIGAFENKSTHEFKPMGNGGFGTDIVLVLDDADRKFGPPGQVSSTTSK